MSYSLSIKQGNLLDEDNATFIVNASNTRLILGSGVSMAFKKYCGIELQNEMTLKLEELGSLKKGDVVVPSSCQANNFEYALHVATMDYNQGVRGNEKLPLIEDIKNALLNIESTLEQYSKKKSNETIKLVLPLIGCGVGGLDKVDVVKLYKSFFSRNFLFQCEVVIYGYNTEDYKLINRVIMMTKDEQKKEYIRLKLLGCIDSKELIAQEYKINMNEIKTTLERYVQKELGISKEYFEELQREEGQEIQLIKGLYNGEERVNGFQTLENFYLWYKNQLHMCCYCGVKATDLKKYFYDDNEQYKNARKRGKVLEIERVITAPTNLYNETNCKLACYVCNNAKSDFISPSAFKPIAKGIYNFWKETVKVTDIEFPEKSTIWV